MPGAAASRSVIAVGLSLAGLALGHAITYAGPSPHAIAREAWLMATGHGYVPGLNRLGLAAGLVVLGAAFLRGLSVRSAEQGSGWLTRRLVAIQLTGFLLIEVTERLISGARYADLVHVLPVGLAVQVGIAIGSVRIVRLMLRTGAAAARFDRAPARQRFGPYVEALSATPCFVGRSVPTPFGGRAPPAFP
ncbi:MAG: hypothetical protein WD096_06105 [Actinomycetota bacterium]